MRDEIVGDWGEIEFVLIYWGEGRNLIIGWFDCWLFEKGAFIVIGVFY